MITHEPRSNKLQQLRDLREDHQICFDRLSDQLANATCPSLEHARHLARMSERLMLKAIDSLLEEAGIREVSDGAF